MPRFWGRDSLGSESVGVFGEEDSNGATKEVCCDFGEVMVRRLVGVVCFVEGGCKTLRWVGTLTCRVFGATSLPPTVVVGGVEDSGVRRETVGKD